MVEQEGLLCECQPSTVIMPIHILCMINIVNNLEGKKIILG